MWEWDEHGLIHPHTFCLSTYNPVFTEESIPHKQEWNNSDISGDEDIIEV